MSWADVYGEQGTSYQEADPGTAAGFNGNQSYVSPWGSGTGTSVGVGRGGTAPALSLVGLVVALVLLRIVVELGGEA
jgi:hypothetical protein